MKLIDYSNTCFVLINFYECIIADVIIVDVCILSEPILAPLASVWKYVNGTLSE